jgi:hypothetical protein
MLCSDAREPPQEVTVEILTHWLCRRDVVRLDLAMCASVCRRRLHQLFSNMNCVFTWPAPGEYNPDYTQWCISRKVRISYVCLQFNDPLESVRAHYFLQNCGSRLRFCKLVGGQCLDVDRYDIPYEALTMSDDLEEFVLLDSVVTTSVVKHALRSGVTILRLCSCKFDTEGWLNSLNTCCTLVDLSFAESFSIPEAFLTAIFMRCPNLQTLNVWNVRDVSDITFVAAAMYMPRLKRLHALNCPVTDIGVSAIAQGCPCLQELFIGTMDEECPISDQSLLDIVQNCPDLQVLWVDAVLGITYHVLQEVVTRKIHLRRLGIANMEGVTNTLIMQAVDCSPALTHISLPGGCPVHWSTLVRIAVKCNKLRHIQFFGPENVYAQCPRKLFSADVVVDYVS